jgi:hypothetical protein
MTHERKNCSSKLKMCFMKDTVREKYLQKIHLIKDSPPKTFLKPNKENKI